MIHTDVKKGESTRSEIFIFKNLLSILLTRSFSRQKGTRFYILQSLTSM